MCTQNIVIPSNQPKPTASEACNVDSSKRTYFSKQPSGAPIQFSTSPNFLSFSQKKMEIKGPLTFTKMRSTGNSTNSKTSFTGSPVEGGLMMFKSQAAGPTKTFKECPNRLSNLAKDVSLEYGLQSPKNQEKVDQNFSNVINRKHSMPWINSTTQGTTQTPTSTSINLSFVSKSGKLTRISSPGTALTFKKKDCRTAIKEYKAYRPEANSSNQSGLGFDQSIGKIPNNSCFNFLTNKQSVKDSFKTHLAETAASLNHMADKPHASETETKPHVKRMLSLNESSLPANKNRRLLSNVTLDDFIVMKHLGKGKFGNVSMVMNKQTGLVCAMKVMEKSAINQQKLRIQLLREIKIQLYLKHQNIAQLYGYFDDEKNIYLLLELCTQGQLYKILKDRKRLPEVEARPLIRQLCEAVDYLHRNRILHRDIKPENILLHQGIIKLCDFGWSVKMQETLRDTFCGTPIYVSPEILQGVKYDEKIDMWSIGVLSYEMLVGRIPFKINTPDDLHKIINDEISFPEYVPLSNEAKDFIRQIMHKNPDDRLDVESLLNHKFLTQQ